MKGTIVIIIFIILIIIGVPVLIIEKDVIINYFSKPEIVTIIPVIKDTPICPEELQLIQYYNMFNNAENKEDENIIILTVQRQYDDLDIKKLKSEKLKKWVTIIRGY